MGRNEIFGLCRTPDYNKPYWVSIITACYFRPWIFVKLHSIFRRYYLIIDSIDLGKFSFYKNVVVGPIVKFISIKNFCSNSHPRYRSDICSTTFRLLLSLFLNFEILICSVLCLPLPKSPILILFELLDTGAWFPFVFCHLATALLVLLALAFLNI